MSAGPLRGRVLILSENAPVPSDRRVWNEARALTQSGYEVTIVCAMGSDRCNAACERLEGIEIHRYPLDVAVGGARGYLREYGQALWRSSRLIRRLARRQDFDVVHACNPPDFLLLAALPLRAAGARFVFDHHDLVPELYLTRFGGRRDPLYWLLLGLERLAFSLADVVIATNESYRDIALNRGRRRPEDVIVVRNGPDLQRFSATAPDAPIKRGKSHLISYLGVMAPQDGVDHALRALALLHERRDDWHAIFMGDGECLDELGALARQLGLADMVEFAGWTQDEQIRRTLSTSDVCLAPDPPNPLNELSTMVKIVEYMAMSCPVVSYDLRESRRSAGEAALYAAPGSEPSFANAIDQLLDDPERRARMGRIARKRVERELAWEHSARCLCVAYARASGRRPTRAVMSD